MPEESATSEAYSPAMATDARIFNSEGGSFGSYIGAQAFAVEFAVHIHQHHIVRRHGFDLHAGRRHQEHGVVVVVLRAIELTGDVDDAPLGRLLLGFGTGHDANQRTEDEGDTSSNAHDADLRV